MTIIASMVELKPQLPSALRANARWVRFDGPRGEIPVMLVHPDWESSRPAPVVIWMHGRTANKELDPGRYLRWMRASSMPPQGSATWSAATSNAGGIGVCAVDLPGHGERFDAALQEGDRTLDIVRQMIDEIDVIVDHLARMKTFDMDRVGIGGVSAGGMAALARLCRPHGFRCASVEATTGSWLHQRQRPMFQEVGEQQINQLNPLANLEHWRPIPFQALHSQSDEWVAFDGQAAFVNALRERYDDPSMIDFVAYERTGAPYEHIGFGRMAADAKDRQRAFLEQWI